MGNFRESKLAASSVVGVILMVGLTVVMAGTVAMSAFVYPLPSDAPDANIVMREARGNDGVFTGNEIVLAHKGGNTLRSDGVKIIIDGEGKEGPKSGSISDDLVNIYVTYENIEDYNYVNWPGDRKDRYFLGHDDLDYAKIASNDTWNPGEVVVLFGADGINSANKNNVDKKYKLKPGSKVTVTIIDIPTNQIIATSFSTVKYSAEVVGH